MVKHLEYVYFNVYNYCHQRNQHLTTIPARLQTMYIISMSAGGWVLFAQAIFLRLVRQAWFSSQALAMSFAMLSYLCITFLFYHIFIVNSYDEKIINKYESATTNGTNNRTGLIWSFLAAAAPYLLMVSLKLFFPRQQV